jgi:hypothetical protein
LVVLRATRRIRNKDAGASDAGDRAGNASKGGGKADSGSASGSDHGSSSGSGGKSSSSSHQKDAGGAGGTGGADASTTTQDQDASSSSGAAVSEGCLSCLRANEQACNTVLQGCENPMAPCSKCLKDAYGPGITGEPGSCKDTPAFTMLGGCACMYCADECAPECGSFWNH